MILELRSRARCILPFLVLFTLGVSPPPVTAQTLRYQPNPDSKFAYRFQISVDSESETTHYKGITKYEVESRNGDQIQLTYRGGLSESKTYKAAARGRRGPFGPRAFPPSIPSPFSRPAFAGKTQTTNQITLSSRGEVIKLVRDSQLPYLLGNVSLIPFEPLPETDEKNWQIDSGIAVTQKDRQDRFGRGGFGPGGFDPFGRSNDDDTTRAAVEKTSFQQLRQQDDLIHFKKDYELKMPETDDGVAYEMSGTGTWTFDKSVNMPAGIDFSYKLVVKSKNSTVTVPITMKYERLSQQEIDAIEAEAKRKAEERAMAAAKAKAEAEAPLTDAQKADALESLTSGDAARQIQTLSELAKKSLQDPDPEIVAAMKPLVESDNDKLRKAAHSAMLRWDAEYKRIASLKSAYDRAGVVDDTKREVNLLTTLYIGQIVQVNEHGPFWKPATIEEILTDGQVRVKLRGGGNRKITVARRKIQLAPKDLPQPKKPDVAAAQPTSQSRTWSDASGRFKVDAVLLRVEGASVVLKRADGREVTVPIVSLSEADKDFLRELQQQRAAVKNPFEP
ncbi:cytoskeleton assembly control protein SLA1 [Rhodopirellula maiorica SM1]|uniref:Cytoskeleton assembly control protein SLA1 n=1 Tax=Rhodopirellula maiorica SM1 TaxID=1265738 RepID=M5RQK5_9BACT|nr:SHD1 domain-containing protein [Rhodopirellula maiorica]EMI16234.1 cytoskeleton assembly control protein SLA1 [Rhodopirellula maiorica SM1]